MLINLVRSLIEDNSIYAERLHLIDAPKSLASSIVNNDPGFKGEDSGEQIKDILSRAGALVIFHSFYLPHEVLETNRESFGVQGLFHELIHTCEDA